MENKIEIPDVPQENRTADEILGMFIYKNPALHQFGIKSRQRGEVFDSLGSSVTSQVIQAMREYSFQEIERQANANQFISWLKKNYPERIKAGVPTFTALEVCKVFSRYMTEGRSNLK